MIHIGLFECIGGFSVSAQWTGWKTLATCEINPFGQKVLNYYWPNAYHHGDIHTFTYETINIELSKRLGTGWRNEDIIVTGGFPCQPYSTAGKRQGKDDERHLWPEMLRAIREIQPTWIVGENIRGLIRWNGGMVFDEVQSDLEAEGYEVIPFLLPACAVNAPHRRDRIWFVAHSRLFGQEKRQFEPIEFEQLRQEQFTSNSNINRCGSEYGFYTRRNLFKKWINKTRTSTNTTGNRREWTGQGIETEKGLQQKSEPTGELAGRFERLCFQGNATNTGNEGLQGRQLDGTFNPGKEREQTFRPIAELHSIPDWRNFPTTQPTIRSRNDGISSRLDGITIPKHRNESIKAYGNAIVPQVAYQIFKAINEYEKTN